MLNHRYFDSHTGRSLNEVSTLNICLYCTVLKREITDSTTFPAVSHLTSSEPNVVGFRITKLTLLARPLATTIHVPVSRADILPSTMGTTQPYKTAI
jgi:hypothetical protein